MKPAAGLSVVSFGLSVTAVENVPPTLVQRDLATVTSAFASVGSSIEGLSTAVQNFNDASDIADLQSASSSLLQAIKSGASTVQATSELTLQESLQLQNVVGGLQTKGSSLGNGLEVKKPLIEQLGLCKIVLMQVTDISTASKDLSDAAVGKVPEAARQIAAQLASGFTDTVAQSQAAFAEGNCTDSASNSVPAAGSTPSSGGAKQGTGTAKVSAAMNLNLAAGGVSVAGLVFAWMLM